jgi:hypothetical protein
MPLNKKCGEDRNTQSHIITTFKPGNAGNTVPEWKGFNYGAHDLNTRVPNADGNPISMIFDTNGASEVNGRDSIIKRNVVQGRPHDPVVYTLPKHSELAQPMDLKPIEVHQQHQFLQAAQATCLALPCERVLLSFAALSLTLRGTFSVPSGLPSTLNMLCTTGGSAKTLTSSVVVISLHGTSRVGHVNMSLL